MDPAQERETTLAILRTAAAQVEPLLDPRLVPPEGISFGFALRGARDTGGIATVSGGIRGSAGGQASAGPCAFGTDEPVARVILTAVKFDPAIRSAAILQFSPRAQAILEDDLFLECSVMDAAQQNPGISTMDWGIASCCRNGIPDVIVRRGAGASGSRIILFGEEPAVVANNIIICSNRI